MTKYFIEVSFVLEVEASNKEEAEIIGWDWTPRYPNYLDGDFIQADRVNVIEGDENE